MNGFTVVEAIALEEVAGATLPQVMAATKARNPTARQMLALVWVVRSREQPSLTFEQVRDSMGYAQLRDAWRAVVDDDGTEATED